MHLTEMIHMMIKSVLQAMGNRNPAIVSAQLKQTSSLNIKLWASLQVRVMGRPKHILLRMVGIPSKGHRTPAVRRVTKNAAMPAGITCSRLSHNTDSINPKDIPHS